MNRLWVALATLAAALLLTTGVVAFGPDTRSTVVYPEQEIPLIFSHRQHNQLGLGCAFCHDANGVTEPSDSMLPGHDKCSMCHQIDNPQAAELIPRADCAACHVDATDEQSVRPVVMPPAQLNFSHEQHAIAQGIACAECHPGVEEVQLATREHLPAMADCMDCHDGVRATDACSACHLQDDGALLLTDLSHGQLMPSGRFRPDDHRAPDWRYEHRGAARVAADACAACHDQAYCEDCHDGEVRDEMMHPNNWIASHGQQALLDQPSCSSCHVQEQFCHDCHEALSVLPSGFPGLVNRPDAPLRFHPEGWADFLAVGPDHHAHHARRGITACSSCHEDTFCADCHRAINPHPVGFAQSGAARGQLAASPDTCLTCHSADDPALDLR